MDNNLKEVLLKVTKLFQENDICFGIGASMLLAKYKIVDSPNDIDIQVDLRDIEEADNLLLSLGSRDEILPDEIYKTKFFYQYVIDGIEIDLMAGLAVINNGNLYEFVFDKSNEIEYTNIDGVEVPYMTLNEWYEIYKKLPNKEKRVLEIEGYYKDKREVL